MYAMYLWLLELVSLPLIANAVPSCKDYYSTRDHLWYVDDKGTLQRNATILFFLKCENETVKTILLDSKKIKDLAPNCFSEFGHITEIQMQGNKINQLKGSPFSALSRLIYLNLGYAFENKGIRNSLGADVFKGLDELTYLNLDHNYLHFIPATLFDHVPKLEFLDFSSNKIEYLHSRTFSKINGLTALGLKKNFLTEIEVSTFEHVAKTLKSLEVFEMSVDRPLKFPCCALHFGGFPSILQQKCQIVYNHDHYINEGPQIDVQHQFSCVIGNKVFESVSGYFNNTSITEACQKCNGYFDEVGICHNNTCPTGYKCKNGMKHVNCKSNESLDAKTQTCVLCPKGHSCSLGYAYPCEKGTYQDTEGALDYCKLVPMGAYADSEGSIMYTKCPKGTYSKKVHYPSTSDICEPCPFGHYSDTEGQPHCTPCQAGTYSDVLGINSSSLCLDCPVGSHANNTGAKVCELCDPGTFANTIGATDCQICPDQTYANHAGATKCQTSTLSAGVIVGIAVGILAFVIIIIVLVSVLVRRRTEKLAEKEQESRMFGMSAEDFVKQGHDQDNRVELQTDEEYMGAEIQRSIHSKSGDIKIFDFPEEQFCNRCKRCSVSLNHRNSMQYTTVPTTANSRKSSMTTDPPGNMIRPKPSLQESMQDYAFPEKLKRFSSISNNNNDFNTNDIVKCSVDELSEDS